MIQALRSHHVNTLVELRRIEKAFAVLGSSDVTEPMTAACMLAYAICQQVEANTFRVVLRQFPRLAYRVTRPDKELSLQVMLQKAASLSLLLLTNMYQNSSESLEEAKRRVYSDPQSNKSWNFCWLVLSKIQTEYVEI